MFIYTVIRAFRDQVNKEFFAGQEITESVYNALGENQVFIKKVFSGTQIELDEYLAKQNAEKEDLELKLEADQKQLIVDKEALAIEYASLFGEEPDKRWSLETLKEKIEAKLAE
jgi:hypothetical protein